MQNESSMHELQQHSPTANHHIPINILTFVGGRMFSTLRYKVANTPPFMQWEYEVHWTFRGCQK